MESIYTTPNYIEADSKEELVKLMFKNNLMRGAYHRYFDIQKDGKKWIAFYYVNQKPLGV